MRKFDKLKIIERSKMKKNMVLTIISENPSEEDETYENTYG